MEIFRRGGSAHKQLCGVVSGGSHFWNPPLSTGRFFTASSSTPYGKEHPVTAKESAKAFSSNMPNGLIK